MDDLKDLAKVVRLHRRTAKLSRLQLAELAGVGKTVIYDIENGKVTIKLDTLGKILKTLNIKLVLSSPLLDNLVIEADEKG